eukprot:3768240-Rhodomonas_salina.1
MNLGNSTERQDRRRNTTIPPRIHTNPTMCLETFNSLVASSNDTSTAIASSNLQQDKHVHTKMHPSATKDVSCCKGDAQELHSPSPATRSRAVEDRCRLVHNRCAGLLLSDAADQPMPPPVHFLRTRGRMQTCQQDESKKIQHEVKTTRKKFNRAVGVWLMEESGMLEEAMHAPQPFRRVRGRAVST